MRPRLVRAKVLVLSCAVGLVPFAANHMRCQTISPLGADGQAKRDKAVLEGRVLDALTGEPLKRVGLSLKPTGLGGTAVAVETDTAGKFVFAEVAPGSYTLLAERAGYPTQAYGARRDPSIGAVLALEAGRTLRDFVFKLARPGDVCGRVLNEDGEPFSGVAVVVLKRAYSHGRRVFLSQPVMKSSDVRGEYCLNVPWAGEYVVFAPSRSMLRIPSAPGRPGADELTYTGTYYPRAINQAGAVPIQVGLGADSTGIDIHLAKAAKVRLKGRVLDVPAGTNVSVNLTYRNLILPLFGRPARIEKDGSFEFEDVLSGSYSLSASVQNRSREYNVPFGDAVPLEVADRSIEGLVLRPGPHQDLSGRVVMEGEKASPRDIRVMALAADRDILRGESSVAADGTFILKELYVSLCLLRIEGAKDLGDWYVKSVRYAGRDVTEEGVDLSGVASDALQITMSPAGAQVSGVVHNRDDKPVQGATVTLIPKSERHSLYKTATADLNGAFNIRGITPGDYRLLAWEDIESGAEEDPEFLETYVSRAEAVSLDENARRTVTLEVIQVD